MKYSLTIIFLEIARIVISQRTGFRTRPIQSTESLPLCETKENERKWANFINDNYRQVFPDYNRNFGGAKWFKFCEEKFCPEENNCDKARMLCCSHSYCPYSGATGGGAARRFSQVLLDYCITPEYSVSICCSPCTCQLSPITNSDMSIQTYKGMPTLFEHSCESCAAAKSRMQPCTCTDANELRPVAVLGECNQNRAHSHGRLLDSEHFKSCSSQSWDPMRGTSGIGG